MSTSINMHHVTAVDISIKQHEQKAFLAFDSVTLTISHKIGPSSQITLITEPGVLHKDGKLVMEVSCES